MCGTSYGVTLSRSGGFSGAVSLSASGLPAGASGTFTPATLTSGSSSTFAVTTTTDVAAGAYPLTITGTSGSLVRTASATFVVQGTAASDFSLGVAPTTQTVVAGAGTSYAVTLTPSGGFSGTVDLSASGFPTGAGGGFSPASLTGGGTSTLTVTTGGTTTPGSYPITIRGTSGSFVHTASATLVVQAGGTGPGDFSLSVAPKAQVLSGGSASYAITVEPTGGFSGQVTLTVSGVPSGFTSSFSSNPTGSAATLTVSGSFGTFRRGTTTVTLVIKGTSGTTSHSTSVTLTG